MILTSLDTSSWQLQTIPIYFRVFYGVPHKKVRKMKLFQTSFLYMSRFKKVNIHKNEFIHDMYTELRNDIILKHGKELVKTVLVTVCGKVLF